MNKNFRKKIAIEKLSETKPLLLEERKIKIVTAIKEEIESYDTKKLFKDAVIDERLNEIKKGKRSQKISSVKKANIKGGETKTGKKLYDAYDFIRQFWVYPANIVHITIIAVIEILNLYYAFAPQYIFLSLYIIVYGSISTLVQLVAFIVNYKGTTVHYYYK